MLVCFFLFLRKYIKLPLECSDQESKQHLLPAGNLWEVLFLLDQKAFLHHGQGHCLSVGVILGSTRLGSEATESCG